jgi:hypothetical protein
VLVPGCRYFALCFRDAPADTRARHPTRADIIACFTQGWRIDSMEATTLDSRTDQDGIPAWLITLTRT